MILVVFGLPGTGKSSLARELADDISAKYLDTDIIREEMNKKGQYDQESKREVYQKILDEVSSPDAQNKTVIVDGTFSDRSFRQMFNKLSWELGKKLYYIEMKAEEETVKERMKEDREHSEADYTVYKKLKKSFDYMPEEHILVKSDKLEQDEMKQKVKAVVDE